ncbi:MAG: HAD family phosphatase [Clostridia bacterium]|nr:HAD family phosphatase [Clostridia bacterium]MBQ6614189.1 HAD family phosphatase [Clostridia bacterium]
MDASKIKLVAFDLDGTLSQHKSPLPEANRETLKKLSEKYKLLMVGAGMCQRIFNQLDRFPIDILGNYGLQYAEYNPETKDIEIVRNTVFPCDKESVEKRVTAMREKYGFTEYKGKNVEYHASGCVTFPILGTEANIEDKLAFDPDRSKRRAIYEDIKKVFSDYIVFVGGSSSFDMAPAPYNKAYALAEYCKNHGISHDEVVFVGDDYGPGGNDESVYLSDFNFITIDNYLDFPEKVKELL